jgi:hypothetical protein
MALIFVHYECCEDRSVHAVAATYVLLGKIIGKHLICIVKTRLSESPLE